MPIGISGDCILIPNSSLMQKKLLGDISNVNELSSLQVSNDVFRKDNIWACRHKSSVYDLTFEEAMSQENAKLAELKQKIENVVIREVCNKVHHSTYTLDDLVESVENYLEDFFVKGEHVKFKPDKDTSTVVEIKGVEKRGGVVFYSIGFDGKEIGKIMCRDLK
uniref:WAC domain-containing protein n=1 Tax=Heterorhabditis bacteriophora TaxID=37862 RepID=A0A1I7XIF8_HETBA